MTDNRYDTPRPSLSGSSGRWLLRQAELAEHERWSQLLEQLLQELCGAEVKVPPGVGELELPRARLEFAHVPQKKFLALRLNTAERVVELFCLALPAAAGSISPLLLGQSTTCGPLLPAAWWSGADMPHEEPSPRPAQVPGFLGLAALALGSEEVLRNMVHADELQEEMRQRQHFQDLASEQAQEIHRLKERLQHLTEVTVLRQAASDGWAEQPRDWTAETNLELLEDWAQARANAVVLLPRARSGAKKSIYSAPEHIFKGLEFLATAYYEYRTGSRTKEAMESALAESGCQLAGSVSPTAAGSQGEAYYVRWEGRRRFMDLHLVKGGGRDERYCLRIYFFWDDEHKKVIVGWLPSHLNNSLS